MKRIPILLLLGASLLLGACGGRPAQPVMTVQYDDRRKSCRAIETEMKTVQQEIARLMPESEKTGKNVALGVAGAFFLVPWFFMDMSDAEVQEINAYRQRYNNLSVLAADKKCDFSVPKNKNNQ